jgi:hypothetical protein
MAGLFKGNLNLPRLVLEYMDSSQIEAQPNCSPEFAMYLEVATQALGLPSVNLTTTDDYTHYSRLDFAMSELERLVNPLICFKRHSS